MRYHFTDIFESENSGTDKISSHQSIVIKRKVKNRDQTKRSKATFPYNQGSELSKISHSISLQLAT